MTQIQPNQLAFRNGPLQGVAQDTEFIPVAQELFAPEIVGHQEAAAANEFSEVVDFLFVQVQESGLRQVQEWIFEYLVTVEGDDLVRVRRDAYSGHLMQQGCNEGVR